MSEIILRYDVEGDEEKIKCKCSKVRLWLFYTERVYNNSKHVDIPMIVPLEDTGSDAFWTIFTTKEKIKTSKKSCTT